MDPNLLFRSASEPITPAAAEWPAGRAAADKYYGVTDHWGDKIIVMRDETWVTYGTVMERQRRTLQQQDQRIREMTATITDLTTKNADLSERLESYRDKTRTMQRARLERELNGAPQMSFLPTTPEGKL